MTRTILACLRGGTLTLMGLLAISLWSGCSGTRSSLQSTGKTAHAKLWPISDQEADSVVFQAMSSALPGQVVVRVGGPVIGYQATQWILADHHNYIATASPVSGKATNQVDVTGFAFEIRHSGSLFEGPANASHIYDLMVEQASQIAPPIEVTSVTRQTPGSSRRVVNPSDRGTVIIASGSGFFISEDGYLLTCAHVVKDALRVEVKTRNGNLAAAIVTKDAANDVALLKVEGKFAMLPLVDSRRVKLGDRVKTIGYPNIDLQGLEPKFTTGEVNSLAGLRDDPRYFQVSIPIQPGNSGGPLVDERGNVVGIVTATLNPLATLRTSGSLPQNVNYAIKSAYALTLVESKPNLPATRREAQPEKQPSAEEVVRQMQDATVLVMVY